MSWLIKSVYRVKIHGNICQQVLADNVSDGDLRRFAVDDGLIHRQKAIMSTSSQIDVFMEA